MAVGPIPEELCRVPNLAVLRLRCGYRNEEFREMLIGGLTGEIRVGCILAVFCQHYRVHDLVSGEMTWVLGA